MSRKDETIIMRVSKEFKTFLKKRAKEKGTSVTGLLEEFYDPYNDDKKKIQEMIKERKNQQPELWKELDKSPIARNIEEYMISLYCEYLDPIGGIAHKIELHPAQLIQFVKMPLEETIRHFDTISEEEKHKAANHYIKLCKRIIDYIPSFKAKETEDQKYIIEELVDTADKLCYQLSAMAFDKDAYNTIKEQLHKVQNKLICELKEKR